MTGAASADFSAAKRRRMIAKLDAMAWPAMRNDLAEQGWARMPALLSEEECETLRRLYDQDDPFRSRVVMQRQGFGKGEYKYLQYPLPNLIAILRTELYSRLLPVANAWRAASDMAPFEQTHAAFLAQCHEAGQKRPTPLLLRYREGDYNRLHQDLYGDMVFPLQVAVLLCEPGLDFEGGEFVLTEQKPRSQSRADVVPLRCGDAVAFAVNERPIRGSRGFYKVRMRHGVSPVRSGERFTLGIVFHDAA